MKNNSGRSHKRHSRQAHRELQRRPDPSKVSKMEAVAKDDKRAVNDTVKDTLPCRTEWLAIVQ